MKVLVTGAAGFIGSHLVERLLQENYEVRAFVRYNAANFRYHLDALAPERLDQVDIVAGDLSDPFSVSAAVKGCDIVFHLGSLIGIPYSYKAPNEYVRCNIQGTLNVLQACLQHQTSRMIHTSTSEVYGTAQYVPIDEQHPLVGLSPYSASKIGADKLAESYHHAFSLPVCTIRPFNTYGPRQSTRAVVPTILSQALVSDTLKLGSLETVRDLTYVTDTVDGFVKAAQAGSQVLGQTINLGVGQGYSIQELVDRTAQLVGRPLSVDQEEQRMRPPSSEVYRLISNNAKARELLGWAPQTELTEGLRRTLEYVKNNLNSLRVGTYCI